MPRRLTSFGCLCALTTACLSAYVAYDFSEASPAPKVRIENADLIVENLRPGIPGTADFVIVNDDDSPIRLVGAGPRCGVNCCVTPRLDGLTAIPPLGRATLTFDLHASKPAVEFSVSSTVYVECRGRTWPVDVSVSGTTSAEDNAPLGSPP